MANFNIINSEGKAEPFSWKKIFYSAQRVGATRELATQIANQIEQEAYPGMTTREIFKKIRKSLLEEKPVSGIRYSLKEAIKRLGPTGFPFEKYVGRLFEVLGFTVLLNQHLKGKCIDSYEIDFIAKIDKQVSLAECKYHTFAGNRVDLKIVLANYAKFLDIKNGDFFKTKSLKHLKLRSLIVTNTKFTSQAIKFAECYHLDLLGWHYPVNRGLEYLIESEKFYPITILPSATSDILSALSSFKIMLVQDLLRPDIRKIAKKANIKDQKLNQLITEAQMLLSPNYETS